MGHCCLHNIVKLPFIASTIKQIQVNRSNHLVRRNDYLSCTFMLSFLSFQRQCNFLMGTFCLLNSLSTQWGIFHLWWNRYSSSLVQTKFVTYECYITHLLPHNIACSHVVDKMWEEARWCLSSCWILCSWI